MTFLTDILPWLTPPIIGAVIGYVTNDIAIRMLFRPLKEARVFGLRVPFTPGIFPRERYKLARSIGRMVSQELITEDALRAQIRAPSTGEQLGRTISSISERVLALPLSTLSDQGLAFLTGSLEETIAGLMTRLVNSPALINAVRGILTDVTSSLSGRRMTEVLDRIGLKKIIAEGVLPYLADQRRRASIASDLAGLVADHAGDILTDETLAALSRALEPFLPKAGERLASWLQTDETRSMLAARGRELLPRILEKLNLLQRFLLSAGQYDRRLTEKMPEIVDDTVRTLQEIVRDPSQQGKAMDTAVAAVRDWREALRGARSDGQESDAAARLSAGLQALFSRVLSTLEDPEVCARVYGALEHWVTAGNQTAGAFLRQAFGLDEPRIVDFLSERALTFLTGESTAKNAARAVSGWVSRFLGDNSSAGIGELLHVDAARKEKLDAFLTTRLLEVIDKRLPEILRGIDVEDLVVKKIDGLDVRDVERLLVQVIASHLKWINVFGAILGFLIGLVQLLMKALRLA